MSDKLLDFLTDIYLDFIVCSLVFIVGIILLVLCDIVL